ncbi:MAG: hypothetical protein WCP69_01815 [Bacteroidota bacterium]
MSKILTCNNPDDLSIIDDTTLLYYNIIEEFKKNEVDSSCTNLFFTSKTPNKIELNNFLFFIFNTIKLFPTSFYSINNLSNTENFSILLSCSHNIVITFEIIINDENVLIRRIFGIGEFFKKISPIIRPTSIFI